MRVNFSELLNQMMQNSQQGVNQVDYSDIKYTSPEQYTPNKSVLDNAQQNQENNGLLPEIFRSLTARQPNYSGSNPAQVQYTPSFIIPKDGSYRPNEVTQPNIIKYIQPKDTVRFPYTRNTNSNNDPVDDVLTQAMGLLRQYEGYRENAYYDKTAYRAGYGSDTVTLPDGSVVRVTKDTKVNKEDAERDLKRRSRDFYNTARRNVGAEYFDQLPPNAQAALTSVAYNYGSFVNLPKLVEAARSGDVNRLAEAVRGLSHHNKGENKRRRYNEAAYILGIE